MDPSFLNCLTITAQCGFHKEVKPFLALCQETWYDVQLWAAVKDIRHGRRQRTHLMYAAKTGNIVRMSWLLSLCAQLQLKDRFGNTALTYACKSGHLEIVRELIARGASVNTDDGCTPLYAASSSGHVEVVRELLAHGAWINPPGYYGSEPLRVAQQRRHREVVRLLEAHGQEDFSSLHRACRDGNIEEVGQLLARGAHLVAYLEDEWRETPLHMAIYNGHLEVVRLLLTHRAFLRDDNWKGESPLFVASESGNLEMVQLLLSVGESVHDNPSPLFAACAGGHLNIVQELIEVGADVDFGHEHQGGFGGYHISPLQIARDHGHIEVQNLLVANGAV